MKVRKVLPTGASLKFIRNWRRWLTRKTADSLETRIERITNAVVSMNINESLTIRLYIGEKLTATLEYQSPVAFAQYFLSWYAKNGFRVLYFNSQLNNEHLTEIARSLAIEYGNFLVKYGIDPNQIQLNGKFLEWED